VSRADHQSLLPIVGRLLAFAGVLGAATTATAATPEPGDPWILVQQYQFAQAEAAFAHEKQKQLGPASREHRLGSAVATLNHPALKSSDRQRALQELDDLWSSRSHAPDNPGLWAGYLLGRWSQTFESPPDYDCALEWYERTANAGGSAYVAQLARLKAAGMWIYAPLQRQPTPTLRLDRATAGDEHITDHGLRVSYLLVLVDGMLLRKADHRAVLARLQELWALNLSETKSRAKTLCQLGTLSALVGDRESAGDYYRQFLEEFPTDIRTQLVRDRLQGLISPIDGGQP